MRDDVSSGARKTSRPSGDSFAFGPFQFDAAAGILYQGEQETLLPPKAAGVLGVLLARAGQLVGKDELLTAVWPDTHVTETVLTDAVSLLRQSLGDDAHHPTYIQTIHRRGYRFVATFERERAGTADNAETQVGSGAVGALPAWRRAIPWTLAAVAAGAAILAFWIATRPVAPSGVEEWDIALPQGVLGNPVTLVSLPSVAVSPVGSHIAYEATDEEGRQRIYLRSLGYPVTIEALDVGARPFFSPNGRWLGYSRGSQLRKISLAGEGPFPICDAPSATGSPTATWAPDGTIYAWGGGGAVSWQLFKCNADGGDPRPIALPEDDRRRAWLQVLSGGRALVYARTGPETVSDDDAEIAVLDLTRGVEKVLPLRGSYPRYVNTGHLVWTRNGTLRAVRFDPERLEVQGEAATVLQGVMTAKSGGSAALALNEEGLLVYIPGAAEADRTLVWVDRDGRPMPLTEERDGYLDVAMSPDGQRLAVTRGWTNHDVWVYELDGGRWHRLTRGWDEHFLVWTPDSERVVFRSNRGGGAGNLWWAAADGSSEPQPLLPAGEYGRSPRFVSPDHRWLGYVESHPVTGIDLWLLPLSPEGATGAPRPLLDAPLGQGGAGAAISRNGRWIAYATNESGRVEIKVTSFPEPGAVSTVSSGGGRVPVWARDDTELFFYSDGREEWMAARVRSGPRLAFEPARPLFGGGLYRRANPSAYDLAPDGERFVMVLFEEPRHPAFFKILPNWGEELKRLLPAPR